MNITEFGQSIKAKYPQYNDMSDEELGNKMLTKYPQYKDIVKTEPNSLGGMIGGGLPGGAVDFLTSGIQDYAKNAYKTVKGSVDLAKKLPQIYSGQISPEEAQTTLKQSNDVLTGAQQMSPFSGKGAGAILDVAGLQEGAKALTHPVETVKSAVNTIRNIPYITKSGTAKVTEDAVKQATKDGVKINWDEVRSEATKGKISSKLIKAINKKVAEYTPASIKNNAQITPEFAYQVRKELGKTYGPSIFDYFTGTNLEKEGAQALRNALSTIIHNKVPNTKLADKLYTIYSKGLGPIKVGAPISWPLKFLIGQQALNKLTGNHSLGNVAVKVTEGL